jgi:hypothetical protein
LHPAITSSYAKFSLNRHGPGYILNAIMILAMITLLEKFIQVEFKDLNQSLASAALPASHEAQGYPTAIPRGGIQVRCDCVPVHVVFVWVFTESLSSHRK